MDRICVSDFVHGLSEENSIDCKVAEWQYGRMNDLDSFPVVAEPMSQNQRVLDAIIKSRTSTREFCSTPISKMILTEIFDVARYAPSNSNSQPWNVHVLQGEQKRLLTAALLLSHDKDDLPPSEHFPAELPADCKARQADFGHRYYNALGIGRNDMESRYAQTGRNFRFFDAPVGLIFSIDRRLTKHSWLDFGLFLQTIMLAAWSRGLATCPQVSFVRHEPVISRFLKLPLNQTIVCGMSLGYARPDAPVNRLNMPRSEVQEFVTFLGFDEL